MLPGQRSLLRINVLLGPLVLGSYVLGAALYHGDGADFWGTVPTMLRPLYTANMFLAALGFIAFTTWWLWSAPAAIGRGLLGAYLAVLVPSILWMPLCAIAMNFGWVGAKSLIVGVLASVALGSVIVAIATWRAGAGRWPRWGALAFCLQTVVLDFAVWPWFFDIPA